MKSLKYERKDEWIMLQLFDTLYSFDYDGDLSPYLMAEEKEDYQMALAHQRRAQTEL